MQINATQAAGLLAFIPAAMLATTALAVTKRGSPALRLHWAMIAVIHILLSLEIWLSLRWAFNAAMKQWLRSDGLYGERRPAQAALLALTFLVAALLAWLAVRKAPSRTLAVATASTAGALLLIAIECVSLHAMDAVLYLQVGPLLLIGWLWLVCGWVTAGAAIDEVGRSLRLRRNCVRDK